MKYWAIFDRYRKDPSLKDLTELRLTTAEGSEESRFVIDRVVTFRTKGWKTVGDRTFRGVTVSEPTTKAGVMTAEVAYCNDITRSKVVEVASGKEADVSPVPTSLARMTVEREADGVWRVATIRNEPAKC